MLILRDYQELSMDGLRDGFANGHRSQLLYLPCGGGKCHGINTPILMADGTIRNVQDIKVGDKLVGPDGGIRNVLSLGHGTEEMFLVTPKKGDPYTCNASHILSLRKSGYDGMILSSGKIIKGSDDIVAIELLDFIASNKTAKTYLKGWRSNAIEFPIEKSALPIPPYILGSWLGDGSSNAPAITTLATKMLDAWTDYAHSLGLSIKVDGLKNGKCPTYHATGGHRGGRFENPITYALRSLSLIKNKHIPDIYKTASISDRLSLIAGLIDSDGSHSKGGYDWISKYEHLANEFAFVVRSVGLSCYITRCKKSIKSLGFVGEYWRCSISGDTLRIPSLDKPSNPRKINKRNLIHGIEITPIGIGEYFGFQIDGDHLYLLGDFTVCHNTEIAISMLQSAASKGNKCAMVMDRRILCNQTSERLDKYGIDHGVVMKDHFRYRPEELIQICSLQTLEARGSFPGLKLLIVDESHCKRKSVTDFIKNNPQVKVVGLSASPFTKGLGAIYSNIVSRSTMHGLIEDNDPSPLTPLHVFIAEEIDMKGAKKVAGEWSPDVVTERGIKITGDIVSEWVKKTHEIFGKPVKTVVFCAGIAHGENLAQGFNDAGYNFISVSHKDDADYRADVMQEFSKPDSSINGLIATDVLSKGWDQADVMIGISARPFSKSFSSHIQQIGRIMRPHADKRHGILLCHSGNYMRFRDQWDELYSNGVHILDDGAEKPKKEPTEKEKKEAKCPRCGSLWPFGSEVCPHCGMVRVRKNDVVAVPGEMVELSGSVAKKEKYDSATKERWYQELLGYSRSKKYKDGYAWHKYQLKFGVEPPWKKVTAEPSPEVLGWITHQNIKQSHSKKVA